MNTKKMVPISSQLRKRKHAPCFYGSHNRLCLLDFQKQGETEGGTDVQCRSFHDLEGVWKYGETRSSVFHLPNQN